MDREKRQEALDLLADMHAPEPEAIHEKGRFLTGSTFIRSTIVICAKDGECVNDVLSQVLEKQHKD